MSMIPPRTPGWRPILTLLAAASLLVPAAYLARRTWSGAREGRPFDPAKVPRLGRTTETLAPGLHYLGKLFPSAAYAIETSQGLVLIDSGLAPDAGPLRRELAALGLDGKPVRAVLLTHIHADHSGGSTYFREHAGAAVHAGAGDARVLAAGRPREAFFSIFTMPEETLHQTPIDVPLNGGETLDFGDVTIRVLSTPGHTPGSTCYLMERGGLRALFTGDVIMKLQVGDQPDPEVAKPIGTYPAYLSPTFRGNAADYLASLRDLRKLPVPTMVLPGHPVDDREPQSPCLTQTRWEALLDGGIHDMEELLARYEKDGADFLDGTPRELLPGLFYLGDHAGASVYASLEGGKLLILADPRSPGLLGFVHERLSRHGQPRPIPVALLMSAADPAALPALKELAAQGCRRIVAPRAGRKVVEGIDPAVEFVAAEDLSSKGWFNVTVIPVAAPGGPSVAYLFERAGKRALVTGQIPIATSSAAVKGLMDDLARGRVDAVDLLASLTRLQELKPDLWLPQFPSNGRNANLYGDEWAKLIRDNQTVVQTARWSAKR